MKKLLIMEEWYRAETTQTSFDKPTKGSATGLHFDSTFGEKGDKSLFTHGINSWQVAAKLMWHLCY